MFIKGELGKLEVYEHLPEKNNLQNKIVVICHPNPLQEGTMDNKVVTTTAKAFCDLGYVAIRFNFRGAGNSEGKYGNIAGEIQDLKSVINYFQNKYNNYQLYLAGFSFGAYIILSSRIKCEKLLAIAPPIGKYDFSSLNNIENKSIIIQGENDEIIDPNKVYEWAAEEKNIILIKYENTTHFFHGKLIKLRDNIKSLF